MILFGGIKKSMYLCRRFSGARQFESKLSFALACKIFAPSYKTCGTTPQRACDGHTYDGARDKQIAASVLSYHRQGPLLREGQERTKGEERACVRDERRTEREEREEQREKREKNNFHHL